MIYHKILKHDSKYGKSGIDRYFTHRIILGSSCPTLMTFNKSHIKLGFYHNNMCLKSVSSINKL